MRPVWVRPAASLLVVTNASRAKRKRAAVRSAKRSRQNSWWYGLTAIVVIAGIALIVYTQATAPSPVGPFLQDSSGTKKDTHWHAALGVYDCDHWIGDNSGSGIWVWPASTPSGSPARAANTNEYAGLHSHDDGVIHMEPLVSAEAGRSATVGLYFQYGGWKLSSTGYSFLGTTVKNGDKCGNATGTLQWETATWNGNTAPNAPQKYTVQTGNPAKYKLFQYNIVVLAFLPPGKTLASIGNPPSLPNLLTAVGAEGQTPPTTAAPPAPSTPATTPLPAPGTTTPAKVTPTTSKP
jgi:hypothetical protein